MGFRLEYLNLIFSVQKFQVEVIHIPTVSISKMVTDRPNITIATRYSNMMSNVGFWLAQSWPWPILKVDLVSGTMCSQIFWPSCLYCADIFCIHQRTGSVFISLSVFPVPKRYRRRLTLPGIILPLCRRSGTPRSYHSGRPDLQTRPRFRRPPPHGGRRSPFNRRRPLRRRSPRRPRRSADRGCLRRRSADERSIRRPSADRRSATARPPSRIPRPRKSEEPRRAHISYIFK